MRKFVSCLILSMVCCVSLGAQDFRTGYFLSNYLFDYRFNPAFMGDSYKGFISVGVGDVTVGLQSSFPLSAFVYKDYDGYQVGIAEGYSSDDLRKKMQNFNKVNVSVNENIFGMGWNRGRTAGSLEVNLRSYTSGYFDFELVKMAYEGLDGIPYSVENTKINTRNWLEVAYGFRSNFSDRFSFGARIKGLIGLNITELNVPILHLDYYGSGCCIEGDSSFRTSNSFLKFPESNGRINPIPELGRYVIGGFGAAADLGFKLITDRDIEIAVSILDLGGLMWRNKLFGTQDCMEFSSMEEAYYFRSEEPDSPTSFIMNPISVEAGARYPISEHLSAGTLATLKIDNTARGWYEIRVGGAYTPAPAFSVAASAAINTLGAGIGLAMNLRIPGIAFTLGSDSIFGLFSFNSDFVPSRKLNTNLHAGLSIAW